MKRVLFVFSLVFLITSLWSPGTASAKSDTVRITISGGRLTKAIEITDPQILALSNAWSGQFLDGSRSPESEPPKGLLAYEVSFFAELAANDVRKVYVVYYYRKSHWTRTLFFELAYLTRGGGMTAQTRRSIGLGV